MSLADERLGRSILHDKKKISDIQRLVYDKEWLLENSFVVPHNDKFRIISRYELVEPVDPFNEEPQMFEPKIPWKWNITIAYNELNHHFYGYERKLHVYLDQKPSLLFGISDNQSLETALEIIKERLPVLTEIRFALPTYIGAILFAIDGDVKLNSYYSEKWERENVTSNHSILFSISIKEGNYTVYYKTNNAGGETESEYIRTVQRLKRHRVFGAQIDVIQVNELPSKDWIFPIQTGEGYTLDEDYLFELSRK